MKALSKSEFMHKAMNDYYKRRDEKFKKEREFMGCITDSIFRCKKESGKRRLRQTGQK